MSRKFFCDICGKETNPNDIVSKYQFINWISLGKNSSPQPKEEEYCKDCTNKIKDAINKIKQEDAQK